MKRALLSLSVLALLASPAFAAKPVATVNGKAVPAYRADVLIANQIAQGQAKTPELDAAVKEELIRREILAQESIKKGFDKKPDVQGELDLAREAVLGRAYLQDFYGKLKISDDDVKKEFAAIEAAHGDKEYKARHILVDTEAEAKDIIEKLKKGEKFEDLAKASKDPGSKDKGGELGWADKTSYVPAFSEAMTKLEKGKFTETPVHSQFGWHVIRLDDMRDRKGPELDAVKPQIVERLKQKAVAQHVLELRKKAKVE